MFFLLIFADYVQFAHAEGMTGPPVDVPAEDAVPDGVIMDGITAEQEKIIESSKESFVFQAEVNRLMDIIINSLCKCPY